MKRIIPLFLCLSLVARAGDYDDKITIEVGQKYRVMEGRTDWRSDKIFLWGRLWKNDTFEIVDKVDSKPEDPLPRPIPSCRLLITIAEGNEKRYDGCLLWFETDRIIKATKEKWIEQIN